jgi:hypothetical protein
LTAANSNSKHQAAIYIYAYCDTYQACHSKLEARIEIGLRSHHHHQHSKSMQLCHGSVARPPLRALLERRKRETHRGELTKRAQGRHLVGGIIVIAAEVVAAQAPPSSRSRHRGRNSTTMVERPSPDRHRIHRIIGIGERRGCRLPSIQRQRRRSSRIAPRRTSNGPRRGRC